MASLLEMARDELYEFFDKEIAPMIRNEEHNKLLCKHILNKFNAKFSTKYSYIAKQHGDSIRVAVDYAHLNIIFFMADTKNGGTQATFLDPCYWGKQNKNKKMIIR